MHIIYLSGGSVHNKIWIEEVKSKFDKFSDGQILYYSHWESGEKNLNFEVETKKISALVNGKDEYFIFAKSIGSVLALKSIYEKIISPKKIVICGHPYNLAKELGFPIDDYLSNLSIPATFIQNEFDPLFSFSELENILQINKVNNYSLIKNQNINTHDYEDYEKLASITNQFFLSSAL